MLSGKSNILKLWCYAGLFITGMLLLTCERDDNGDPAGNGDTVVSLVFFSLTTDKDTVSTGEIATITASAAGNNLKYSWSATAGSILGSGNIVSYATGSCNAGKNIITCTVTDAYNDSVSKTVSIYVTN